MAGGSRGRTRLLDGDSDDVMLRNLWRLLMSSATLRHARPNRPGARRPPTNHANNARAAALEAIQTEASTTIIRLTSSTT